MSEWLPESLLEMHFHRALVDYFTKLFGARFLSLLKPSQQKEAWVGFDQGWIISEYTEEEVFNRLKSAINTNGNSIDNFYIGYFLQFKTVKQITRRSKRIPSHYSTPYYRSELSLKPNKITGISQHETLLRLNGIRNTIVYYACGMLFEQSELYEDPSLDRRRFVDISSAPTGWATNESHSITFQMPDDTNPFWCSKPIEGKAIGMDQLYEHESNRMVKLSGEEAISLVRNAVRLILGEGEYVRPQQELFDSERLGSKYLPDCFTLLEMSSNNQVNKEASR